MEFKRGLDSVKDRFQGCGGATDSANFANVFIFMLKTKVVELIVVCQ
jgi:hypothetical protein